MATIYTTKTYISKKFILIENNYLFSDDIWNNIKSYLFPIKYLSFEEKFDIIINDYIKFYLNKTRNIIYFERELRDIDAIVDELNFELFNNCIDGMSIFHFDKLQNFISYIKTDDYLYMINFIMNYCLENFNELPFNNNITKFSKQNILELYAYYRNMEYNFIEKEIQNENI